MKKLLSILGSLTLTASISSGVISCTVDSDNTVNLIPSNETAYATNENVNKGADSSRYAMNAEEFLFSKGIKKADGTYYNCYEFADTEITINGKNILIQDYLDQNMTSYIDGNGDRQYANMFKIMADKGIDTIRLNLWVKPFDGEYDSENKFDYANNYTQSYAGGHSDLTTDMYIMKQAKKNGIKNFILDMFYSDTWSYLETQNIPKDWKNIDTTDELLATMKDYTKTTFSKIYDELGGEIPDYVQLGNEISYGLWPEYLKSKFNLTNVFPITIDLLKASIDGLKEFVEEKKMALPKLILHVDTGAANKFQNEIDAMKIYMSDQELKDEINIIGISWYPSMGPIYSDLLNKIIEVFHKLGKPVWITDTNSTYSKSSTNRDGFSCTGNGNIPNGPSSQVRNISSLLNELNTAEPESDIGIIYNISLFNYWGRDSERSPAGSAYELGQDSSFNSDSQYGDTSSSNGLFDRNGIALPILDYLGSYGRPTKDNDDFIANNTQFEPEDVSARAMDSKYTSDYYYNSRIYINNAVKNEYDLDKQAYEDIDNTSDKKVTIYRGADEQDLTASDDEILNKIKVKYARIMWDQVTPTFDYKNSTVILTAKESGWYYKSGSSTTISYEVRTYNPADEKNSVDLSDEEISVATDSNETITTDILKALKDKIDTKKYASFLGNEDYQFKINDNGEIVAVDNDDNETSYANTIFSKSRNSFRDIKIDLVGDGYLFDDSGNVVTKVLNNSKVKRYTDLITNNNIVYLVVSKKFTNSVTGGRTFVNFGAESKDVQNCLVIKLSIKLAQTTHF